MTYSVKNVFDTIQGEGHRAGRRSVFVRFAGCNLWDGRPEGRASGKGACALWCDTDFVGGEKLDAQALLARMDSAWTPRGARSCVLTGGEPALQVDIELVDALHESGWFVAMETNGTRDTEATQNVDWLTVSPKIGGAVVARRASELKVVLPGVVEGVGWTDEDLRVLASLVRTENLFVQPADPLNGDAVEDTYLHPANHRSILHANAPTYEVNLARCLEFVRANPAWRLGAQLHKVWRLP